MTAPVLVDRLVIGPSSEALNTTRGVRRRQWDRPACVADNQIVDLTA